MKTINIFIFLIATLTVSAQNYYVSPTGDNSNSGTSISEPFLTIQEAIDNAVAGSSIYVMAGIYSITEPLWLDGIHGTSGNAITITNYQNDIAIINGLSLSGGEVDLFFIENTSFVTINGLILENN